MNLRNKRFVISFGDGRAAFAVHVSRRFDPGAVAQTLGFTKPLPTIYVTGGAGAMSAEDMQTTRNIVEKGLARFAEDRGAAVIDGGTQAGIPILLGDARQKHRYRFPLIGIAPLELVHYPGYDEGGPATLNPAHSHFVLTAGDEFGDESDMITKLTYALSGSGEKPALGILINGGQIAREEVYARTTSELSLPLIVIEGTGRFADILARAFYQGETDDEKIHAIVKKGHLSMVSINNGPDDLYQKLIALFEAHKPPVAAAT
jgi:TRPM family ion channel